MSVNLHFHESFAPEREHLSELLRFVAKNEGFYTKEEISNQTNIPTGKSSGKVIPHIKYAVFMGLLLYKENSGKVELSLTTLGELVVKEDPYFMEQLSLFLSHYNLVSKESNASLWKFIFNECVPSLGTSLKSEVILPLIKRNFKQQRDVNLSPLRTCYTTSKSFGDLSILSIEKDMWEFQSHSINKKYKYMYGYQLLKCWEEQYPSSSDITLPLIIQEIRWGIPYLWDEETVMDVLDLLSDSGLVTINRQLYPVVIIKNATSAELINRIYSLIV